MFDWLWKMTKTKDERQFEILDQRLIDIQGRLKKLRVEIDQQANSNQGKFDNLTKLVVAETEQILKAIQAIQPAPVPNKSLEVTFVFKVANDHQDEPYSIAIGSVTDAEGETLPDTRGLTVEVTSSDDTVVSPGFDSATNSGIAHFGKSGVASLNAVVKNAKGDILGSGAADFTVTTGDPAAVSDVKISFGGLTEEAPPVEG
jgi:hypothetical protein